MRVVAVGAHPDDIDLGVGGTIAKHCQLGHEVIAVVLSLGESGGDPEVRRRECERSLRYLGVDEIRFAELPDRMLLENLSKAIDAIEDVVMSFKPDIVYAHSEKDRHQDHLAASIASKVAARRVPRVLLFETPSTLYNFAPQVFVDITDTLEKKIEALKMHESQKEREYVRARAIRGLAEFRGLQAGVEYAEAFEVFRIVVRNALSI